MDQALVSTICKKVYAQYPEVSGSKPSIQSHGEGHLLIFKGKVKTADGKAMPRIVRVTVGADGKIGKISTSK